MKLLVVTQKVDLNDDDLGFFHGWLVKLAQRADLFVIANQVGMYDLPPNVVVYSLGKEKGVGKIMKLLNYQALLLKLVPKVDGLFFHMCTEYVIGAGILMKIYRKKSLLWYAHKNVSWKLRLSSLLVNKIFTPSKESCRLENSKKIEITGHGIDIDRFVAKSAYTSNAKKVFNIISVGRISPVKNIHLLLEVAEILRQKNFSFYIKIAGSPITARDKNYFNDLLKALKDKKLENYFSFVGPISNFDIVAFYQNGDLFVNLSDTGSIDKAVLEAMACGIRVLTSNEAFKPIILSQYFTQKEIKKITEKIILLSKLQIDSSMQVLVKDSHNLNDIVSKVIKFYE